MGDNYKMPYDPTKASDNLLYGGGVGGSPLQGTTGACSSRDVSSIRQELNQVISNGESAIERAKEAYEFRDLFDKYPDLERLAELLARHLRNNR
jgi:hypothetical protein